MTINSGKYKEKTLQKYKLHQQNFLKVNRIKYKLLFRTHFTKTNRIFIKPQFLKALIKNFIAHWNVRS